MPNLRNTYNLDACSRYSIRECNDDLPCEFHAALQAAKSRGVSLAAYIQFLEAQKDEQKAE